MSNKVARALCMPRAQLVDKIIVNIISIIEHNWNRRVRLVVFDMFVYKMLDYDSYLLLKLCIGWTVIYV